MRREVRINLIVLAVLVPLMAPGLVILVKKKSKPGAAPMFAPSGTPREAAYVDHTRLGGSVRYVVPEAAALWVGEVARQRLGESVQPGQGRVSERRRVELAGRVGERVGLIVWDEQSKEAQAVMIPVPEAVRSALRDLGYVLPPRRVGWVERTLPRADEGAEVVLMLESGDQLRVPAAR